MKIKLSNVAGSCATAVAALMLCAVAVEAQTEATGKDEYQAACASCHGDVGAGPGPMKDFLSISPPSLTTLAKDNDGVFPMLKVIHIIDGRTGVRGHGGEGMPVWGSVYKMEAAGGTYAAEIETRGRLLSLALYLESIQE